MAKVYAVTIVSLAGLMVLGGSFIGYRVFAGGSENAGGGATSAATAGAAAVAATQPMINVTGVLEGPSDKLLKEVLGGIEENRKKLKTLQLQGEATSDEWDPTTQGWWHHFSVAGSAWLEAAPPRRARIRVNLQQTPVIAGDVPFTYESYTEVWDGTALRRLMDPGDPRPPAEGQILHSRELNGEGVTGHFYSMQLMWTEAYSGERKVVDRYELDAAWLAIMDQAARRVVLSGGQKAVELTLAHTWQLKTGPIRVTYQYWFDPERGYGMLGSRESNDRNGSGGESIIDRLVEAAPGVFYPAAARGQSWFDGKPSMRRTFKARQVIANQPIPPARFILDFPPGLPVREAPAAPTQPAASQPAPE